MKPASRGALVRTDLVREVKIAQHADGERFALWRWRGSRSLYWYSCSVPLAERAIRAGEIAIAGSIGPAVAWSGEQVPA